MSAQRSRDPRVLAVGRGRRARRGADQPETFDVLGFMHICGTMRDGDEAPAASSWIHDRGNVFLVSHPSRSSTRELCTYGLGGKISDGRPCHDRVQVLQMIRRPRVAMASGADFAVIASAEGVHPGEVVAIVGESGSGKTTLLK